ncbi:MAG TPA: hypothetical protein VLC95_12415 [Anaerolineae bacterium]|nr:hypothetical protein [Anaerolineae bacterium]
MFYFGYLIWGLCFVVVAACVSIVSGAAAYFLARKKKPSFKEIASAVTVAGVFVLLIGGCTVSFGWCSGNFDCDRGFGDYFRIPVRYPYQISAIDTLDDGCLDVWPGDGSCLLWGITEYAANDVAIVGRTNSSWTCSDCTEQWFSFGFDVETLEYYRSKPAFVEACNELGFAGEPGLLTVREHFERSLRCRLSACE